MTAWSDDPHDFRSQIRAWLAAHRPEGIEALANWATPWADIRQYEKVEAARQHPLYQEWESALLAERLICARWPGHFGGSDWDIVKDVIFDEECAAAGLPRVRRGFGESMVGPALMLHGSDNQKEHFLPRIVSGADRYCQGFSEPDHGSDLADVQTRAAVDGDDLVITGQKVWTDNALDSNMMFMLCRTNPDAVRHRGLSFVLVPLEAREGLIVRPIKMINGSDHFCEEFLDGLRVPMFNVIGGLDRGWEVAMTTLGLERGADAVTQYLIFEPEYWDLLALARKNGKIAEWGIRQELASLFTQLQCIRFAGLRTFRRLVSGEGSSVHEAASKLRWSEYHRRLGEVAMKVCGPECIVRPSDEGYEVNRWQDLFLSSRAGTIHSGTSEIQRNIIAERVLGLPRDRRL
jgi:alkylation response protein AidB-like acyl-CoA dehydrogenase